MKDGIVSTRITPRTLVLALIFSLLFSPAVLAAEMQTFAVLPFETNADKDITYVQKGISRMLYSRLSWPDKVKVIPPKTISRQLENTWQHLRR
jgi:hypothetical protein